MKRFLLLSLVFLVMVTTAPALADGDFYVVAVGGGVGTKITSLPYAISTPGLYYLTGNLSNSGISDGITVSVDDVTIDLMGFRISGPGSSSSSNGINLYDGNNGHKNVEVRNGTISGWSSGLTDNGKGYLNRALNLRIENCASGINFGGSSGGNLVKGCSVEGGSGNGISINGGVASGNTVINCASACGIIGSGTVFSGNMVKDCSTGIYSNGASTIIGNTVVNTNSHTYAAIYINGPTDYVLVTQNTVGGPAPRFYNGGGSLTINVSNAGF
jgi:hypothetical protein